MLAAVTRPALDLAAMLVPVLPWRELLVRGIIVYGFLLGLIRLTGRRQTGMMTPFDFILLLSRHFRWAQWALVGRPVFLVRDGVVMEKVLHRERITRHELMAALRAAGCPNIELARDVVLETNGSFSVIHKEPA